MRDRMMLFFWAKNQIQKVPEERQETDFEEEQQQRRGKLNHSIGGCLGAGRPAEFRDGKTMQKTPLGSKLSFMCHFPVPSNSVYPNLSESYLR